MGRITTRQHNNSQKNKMEKIEVKFHFNYEKSKQNNKIFIIIIVYEGSETEETGRWHGIVLYYAVNFS